LDDTTVYETTAATHGATRVRDIVADDTTLHGKPELAEQGAATPGFIAGDNAVSNDGATVE
jgi:hypothetical protein